MRLHELIMEAFRVMSSHGDMDVVVGGAGRFEYSEVGGIRLDLTSADEYVFRLDKGEPRDG